MVKRHIVPDGVYTPTWQFSQAVAVSGEELVFVSGIMGYRVDGSMPEGIVAQADQAFANLAAVVAAAGGSLADVIKVTVYVGEDYALHRDELREVRSRHFAEPPYPASTLVQVAGFANPDYLIEVEAVAAVSQDSR
jgi:2-iminobutanoate/2-iminopropanoate deaminase